MMNKTLALVALLTLPIAVYGKTVGTTSIGFDFGEITSDHKNASSVDGYYWDFGLNFNISNKDSYGLDLALDFAYSSDVNNEDYVSGLPGTYVSYKYTQFDYALRPFIRLSDIIVFAELGSSRIHLYEDDENSRFKSTSFVPSVGFRFDSNKIGFTPSVDFLSYGDGIDDGIKFNIPLSYTVSDAFELNLKYSSSDIDPYELEYLSVGFDLRFK